MKQLLLLTATLLMMMGMLACSSCNKKFQDEPVCNDASCPIRLPEAGTNDNQETTLVQQENWQFTLIGSGWEPRQAPYPQIKVSFVNRSLNAIVFFIKDSTDQAPAQYIVNTFSSIKASGRTIVSAEPVVVNNQNYLLITTDDGNFDLWVWIMSKNDFGYVFSCAIEKNANAGTASFDRCNSMANTLQVR